MVLIVITSALQSGVSILFLKLCTELLQSGELGVYIGLTIFCVSSALISAVVNLHMLNLAMKYYDQIEVIPIYSTFIMIMWISTGLIVFDEVRFYSSLELMKIIGSILICCVGIYILTLKTKKMQAATLVEKSEQEIAKSANDSRSEIAK